MTSTTNKSVADDNKLENCLTKAIEKYNVRGMLTQYGITGDTAITLNMYFCDDSKIAVTKVAAICSVPSATEKKRNSSETISVKEFKKNLTENFMDPAITDAQIDRYFLDGENTLTLTFSDKDNNLKEELITVMACRPGNCGRPWCGTRLVR